MDTRIKWISSLALTLLIRPFLSLGQPSVDIELIPAPNGKYELRLVPGSDFDGVLSGLVFTIGYTDDASNGTLSFTPAPGMELVAPVVRSGNDHEVNGVLYRVFSGIGLTTMAEVGQRFIGGMPFPVGTITPGPGQQCWLADDDWTRLRRNNAAYFISLNGLERTGEVRHAVTEAATDPGMKVFPDPWSTGPITIEFEGTTDGSVIIEILDGLGRMTYQREWPLPTGSTRFSFTPDTRLATGRYSVRLRTSDGYWDRPLMVSPAEKR